MTKLATLAAAVIVSIAAFSAEASADVRIGGGIHYLKTVGDLKDASGFDDQSVGFLGGVRLVGPLLTLEGDVEVVPDYAGSDEILWQPQGYAFVGNFFYGGVGIGVGYLGELGWQSDPFYALRVGVDFVLGSLDLDAFVSYRFQKADDLSALGSDDLNTLTLGAMIFFGS